MSKAERAIQYKFNRMSSGVINPRSIHDSFEYKGETLSIKKSFISNSYSLSMAKKGVNSNKGQFKGLSMNLTEEELFQIKNWIEEALVIEDFK